jgi:hypothetical protein
VQAGNAAAWARARHPPLQGLDDAPLLPHIAHAALLAGMDAAYHRDWMQTG